MNSTSHSKCYHCGLPVLEPQTYRTEILSEQREMCCPGCLAVAEAIVASGLEDYYKFRTEPAEKGDIGILEQLDGLEIYDDEAIQDEFVYNDEQISEIQLTIEGISCAACGWLIEKRLSKLPAIKQIAVNVSSRRASISWFNEKLKVSELLAEIEKIGYHALPFHPDEHERSYNREQKSYLKRLGLAGLMSMQVMMIAFGLYFGVFGDLDPTTKQFFHWISLILSTPVVFYSGSGFVNGAINAMRAGGVNMDIPIVIAIMLTYFASAIATITDTGQVYFESICMFIFLLLISRYYEHQTRYQAAQISANMLKFIPVSANLIEDGKTQSCLAKKLVVGQQVMVKMGETIPVDGEVLEGQAWVDESMLTGEFEAVTKSAGDKVFGGTLNQNGHLIVRVEKPLKQALVNQIIRLQESALASKPKTAQIADQQSQSFVFIVLAIATVAYIFWYFYAPEKAFWICIAILVATCPCAMGLATPSALTCAMARLNKLGMLLKRSDALEQLIQVDTLVMDKTGTLTKGYYSIDKVYSAPELKDKVLSIAASLETYSEHPIARAFSDIEPRYSVENFKAHIGMGIEGVVDGHYYRLGNADFTRVEVPQAWQDANIYLETDGQLIAGFCITDKIKSEAQEVINQLSDYDLVVLSGDGKEQVNQVADKLGVKQRFWQQTPAKKLQVVESLQQQDARLLMLGDGVNDAPVLAKADVSVAVGNANDLAKNAADIIMLTPSLAGILDLLKIAKLTQNKIKQNMAWALGYNVLILPLAVTGLLEPWMAVIGMSLSSIIVVTNSTRLLR